MFYWDETKWNKAGGIIDPNNNVLSIQTNRLSLWALFVGESDALKAIYLYPNPCYPERGEKVTIANLPLMGQVKVCIYDVAGKLVRTLEEGDEISTEMGSKLGIWDCKNDDNEIVARGVYLYLVESQTGTKTGKIAVIR